MSRNEISIFDERNFDIEPYYNDSNKLRQAIHLRKKRMRDDYLALGRDLYIIYNRQSYLDWGHATYEDYIEREAEIGYEAAQRYKRYWKKLIKECGCSLEDFDGLSISHVGILSRIVTKDTANHWIGKARALTCNQLSAEVKKEKDRRRGKVRDVMVVDTDRVADLVKEEIIIDVQAVVSEAGVENEKADEIKSEEETYKEKDSYEPPSPDEPERLTKLMIPLFESQLKTVREALAKSERMSGSDKIGHNMTLIATNFLANNARRDKSFDVWIGFLLKSLEMSVGGKFLWIKEEGFKDCPKEIAEFLGIEGAENDNNGNGATSE